MANCGAQHPSIGGLFCNLSPRLHPEHSSFDGSGYIDWINELYVPSKRVQSREDRQRVKALAQKIRGKK